MAKGNDAQRKIRAGLSKRRNHRAKARTISDLRKLVAPSLGGKDFEMNLRAMHGAGELEVCRLQSPDVCVALKH